VDFAERILERFKLRAFFSFVDGGDVGISKQSQLERLRATGLVGPESIMIGDRAVDIDAASANGLGSAGVSWGYGTEAELKSAGAGSILRCTDELRRFAVRRP
jgi:phosphoglycolate phosphatase